jgi:hypothetical protein
MPRKSIRRTLRWSLFKEKFPMRKTLLRITVGAAAAAAAVMGSGVAQAAETVPNDQYPTTDAMVQQWNDAGGHIGYGATSLVSAAWVGIPSWAIANTLGLASGQVDYIPADH